MHSRAGVLVVGAFFVAAQGALAGVPDYEFVLQARTNFAVNPGGSFNIPTGYFFSGENIAINNAGQVAFRLSVTPGDFQSVWYGDESTGGLVYNSPNGASLTGVSLNDNGRVVWGASFLTTPGIYTYDAGTGSSGFYTNQPFGVTTFSSPEVNNDGQVGYRGGLGFSGNGYFSVDPSVPGPAGVATHALEVGLDPGSPYSFLFTPSFNNNRQIASSVRYGPGLSGSNPDEIRIFNADGTSILIAQDDDADPASPYQGFDNSPRVNDVGQVAFIATLAGGGRGVFVSDGTTTTTIATTNQPEVSDIEFFGPDINNSGLVTFRARNGDGIRSIFVGDGNELKVLVSRFDIVPSDQGPARVDQESLSTPAFGGAPRINDQGDVAFNCGLTPPDNDQVEWGTGVFVARAIIVEACPGDLNGDEQVDSDDLGILLGAFGATGDGDLDDDGDTDSDDLGILLSAFGASC
ncbi:MAG: DUF7453 family protein [Phycisphaerales bacterium]